MTGMEYMNEIKRPTEPIQIGEKGTGWSEKIQEWLNLHTFHTPRWNRKVAVDDWFGGGTKRAVQDFQSINGLDPTGV